jgi:hypothetical protein
MFNINDVIKRNDNKLIVIANRMEHIKYWTQNHIIPITNKYDLPKLRGIKIASVYEESHADWLDYNEVYQEFCYLIEHGMVK